MDDNEKYIEGFVKNLSFEEVDVQHRDALKAQLLNAFPRHRLGPRVRWVSIWRVMARTRIAKLTVAAVVLLMVSVLWRTVGVAGKAYALSDVPGLVGQARTIHVRMRYFSGGQTLRVEYWSDLENGRLYRYREGLGTEEGPNGMQVVKSIIETVCDGQLVMRVDHRKKTVEFERPLASQEEPRRLIMIDRASTGTLEDIQNLDRYIKVDQGRIDGRQYDIWRREFRVDNSDGLRIRYEYWVSPATGAVGRMTYWGRHNGNREWELRAETDRIEINVEPPIGIFRTEPPAGYAPENQKATAEMVGLDLDVFHSLEGHTLRVPASFALEDGSILACWRGTHESVGAGPEALYENLIFGGDLPRAPAELLALMSYRDESDSGPMIHYVGRHLMVTHKAGRVYEWALYVPQQEIAVEGASSHNVAFIGLNISQGKDPVQEPSWWLTSFVVTDRSFAEYVRPAMSELSDTQAVPAEMAYDNLLVLARQIRSRPDLYEASRKAVAQARDRIGVLEPVKPEDIVTPEQAGRQARQLAEAFYAAIVEGRDADAVKMLRYEEPRASRVVAGMKQLPGVRDIKVEWVYATDEAALVLTNEFTAYEGRSARWAIGVLKEKGTWLIEDFDATTTDTMRKEIDKFLQVFPKAQRFPEP